MNLWRVPTLLLLALVTAQDDTTPSGSEGVISGSDVVATSTPIPSAITGQPSAVTGEPSGVTGEPSAVTGEPSAVTGEPSAVTSGELPVTSGGLVSATVTPDNTTVIPDNTTVTSTPPVVTTGSPDDIPPALSKVAPELPQSKYWTYPQQPIPARTASAAAAAFTVAMNDPPRQPQTREYFFDIGYSAGAPSGFQRQLKTINNQFPGPLIEGWQGDTMRITVMNNLDSPQTIHWHGIVQNHTNFMDGVPGIHQCPIGPGKTFTYEFQLVGEVGTYWYHSHFGNTMADGVFGAFIVHSRDDPLQKSRRGQPGDYDEDKVLFLGDHYHDQSELIAKSLHTWGEGYRGLNIVQMPDAILINGVGQEDCNRVQEGVRCGPTTPTELKGRIGSKIRLRLINHGSRAQIRFSIDQHPLKVIEVDDTPIKPIYLREIAIDPGQRYSVVVHLNQGNSFDRFWMRATAAAGCILNGFKLEGLGVLRYTDYRGIAWSADQRPETIGWTGRADPLNTPCHDIDEGVNGTALEPLRPEEGIPPTNTYGTFRFDSVAGSFIDPRGNDFTGFGFNPYSTDRNKTHTFTSFQNFVNDPLLRQIEGGLSLNASRVASLTFDRVGAVDLIINNRDGGLSHPYHLHGRPGYIMYRRENGLITQDEVPNLQLNPNPIKRDTITIAGNSSIIYRVITDTPGVWPLHCHIGWHLSEGKLAAVVVQPDAIKASMSQPAPWKALCTGPVDEVELGRRRSLPPQARNKRPLEIRNNDFKLAPNKVVRQEPAPTPTPTFDSPNGANVPYYSQNRFGYTQIVGGVTTVVSVTPFEDFPETRTSALAGGAEGVGGGAGAGGAPTSATVGPSTADSAPPEATQAYSALANRPLEEVWSAEGPLPTNVQATPGSSPKAAVTVPEAEVQSFLDSPAASATATPSSPISAPTKTATSGAPGSSEAPNPSSQASPSVTAVGPSATVSESAGPESVSSAEPTESV